MQFMKTATKTKQTKKRKDNFDTEIQANDSDYEDEFEAEEQWDKPIPSSLTADNVGFQARVDFVII